MWKFRHGSLVGALLAVALLTTSCAGGDALQQGSGESGSGGSPAPKGTVVIGSTNFVEQLVLANMYAELLRDRGVKVQTRLNIGTRDIVFPALKTGELSLVPEYTGALLSYLTDGQADATKPDKVLSRLREELPKEIKALKPAPAQNKDALVVTQETAQKYNLQTISDLKGVADEMVIGGPPELKERAVGLPGYKKVYGLEFKDFRPLDTGGPITKNALKQGDIDVARLFTTDPSIKKNNWVVLEDNKNLIPAQNLIPVIRKKALTPTIRKALNELSTQLTTDAMFELNEKVQLQKKDPAKVAHNWLVKNGLIKS